MTPSEKIKTIDNKIEQNKAQYNLDRQTAKISVLSSGNVEYFSMKYEVWIFHRRRRFTKERIDGELKKQTDIANKQYQVLDKIYEFDETISKEDKKPTPKKSNNIIIIVSTNIMILKNVRIFLLN